MKLFKTQVSRCPIKSNLDKTDWAQEDFGWAEEKLRGVWVNFCLTIWRGRPITHLQIPRSCQKRHKPNKWLTLTISFCSASCGFIHDEAHTSLKRRFLVGKSSWEHDFSEKSWLIPCSFFIIHPFLCYIERGLKSTNTNVWFQLLSGCPVLKTSSKRGCYCTAQFEP